MFLISYKNIFDTYLQLHQSQTDQEDGKIIYKFDTHLQLHQSQTQSQLNTKNLKFDTHLKLHQSQTSNSRNTPITAWVTLDNLI